MFCHFYLGRKPHGTGSGSGSGSDTAMGMGMGNRDGF